MYGKRFRLPLQDVVNDSIRRAASPHPEQAWHLPKGWLATRPKMAV
jgi:hypothetical protein